MIVSYRRLAAVAAIALFAIVPGLAPTPVSAKLGASERGVLIAYLTALQRADYAKAFSRLSDDERRYFRSASNFGAVFAADHLRIKRFAIVESSNAGAVGTIAVVRETFAFFDHAHQRTETITANVRYGVVAGARGLTIKDPFHPWFAFAPSDASVAVDGVSVSVRKVAFYTGRIEVLATFANTSDRTVTILPYGRSLVRDDAGGAHAPIRSKLPGLTDSALFEGLRLPPSAQYTGAMTFFTADRFTLKRLLVTFAPALADGADAPFEFKLPEIVVPAAS